MSFSPYTRLVLCGAVLIAAFLSQVLFSQFWFTVAIQGHTFRSTLLLDLLGCVPFLWPFIAGGALLARRSAHIRGDFIYVVALGIGGGLLYSRLVTLLVTPPDSVFQHPRFLIRYAFPLAALCVAYFGTRLLRHSHSLRAVMAGRRVSKTNERYEYGINVA